MAIDDKIGRMRAARVKRPPKVKKPMRTKSLKKRREEAKEKKLLSPDGQTPIEQWHQERRWEMTGICACGCTEPSQKYDDINFRSSAAHVFPKGLFDSVKCHPLNWVERRVWAGRAGTNACHSIMDDTSMDRWPNMADWEDIKAKFHLLVPYLTVEEKATNFYTRLEKLVYEN